MPTLLPTLSDDTVSPDAAQRVEEIAARLDECVSLSVADSRLRARKNACEEALKLASESPAAARRLVPLLLTVLEEECQREYADTVDEYFGRLSKDAERAAAKTLVTVAGSSLLEAYDESDYSVTSLLDRLMRILEIARTPIAQQSMLAVLAGVVRYRPDEVATKCVGNASSIGAVIAQSEHTEVVRFGARLLAAIATRYGEALSTDQPELRQAYETISQVTTSTTIFDYWSAHAWLIQKYTDWDGHAPADGRVDSDGSTLESLSNPAVCSVAQIAVPPVQKTAREELQTRVRTTDETRVRVTDLQERARAAQALGEVVAAIDDTDDMLLRLAARVRTNDNKERVIAARALGEAAAATDDRGDALAVLADHVRTTEGRLHSRAARALGEWVALTDDSGDSVTGLAAQVRTTDGEDRVLAAEVLGEVVAATDTATEDLSGLAAQIRITDDMVERKWAASAFCMASTIINDSDDPVAVLAAQVRNTDTSLDNEWAARALGEVVATTDASVESRSELADYVRSATGLDRRHAAEALGIAVALTDSSDDPVARLAAYVRTTDGIERSRVAEALGIAVALTDNSDDPVARLAAYVRTTDGRKFAAKALGEAVAAREADEEILSWLTAQVRSTDGIVRRMAARALGEVVATTDDTDDTLAALAAHVRTTDGGDRRLAAQTLGYAVVMTDGAEDALSELAARARTTDDLESGWATQALGEMVALTDTCEDTLSELAAQVRTISDDERDQAVRALGEAVASNFPDEPDTTDILTALLRHDLPSEHFAPVASTADNPVGDFLAAVAGFHYETSGPAASLRAYLRRGNAANVLEALTTVCERDDTLQTHPDLQATLQKFITSQTLSAGVRREALRVLKQLPTTATDVPHSTPE